MYSSSAIRAPIRNSIAHSFKQRGAFFRFKAKLKGIYTFKKITLEWQKVVLNNHVYTHHLKNLPLYMQAVIDYSMINYSFSSVYMSLTLLYCVGIFTNKILKGKHKAYICAL
jgi:hypothetical protein